MPDKPNEGKKFHVRKILWHHLGFLIISNIYFYFYEYKMIRGSVIISQLLISAQLFDSRKRLNMESA